VKRLLALRLSAERLIWLSSVKWAEIVRLIVHEFRSQPALSGRFVLQVRLVGDTAF